MAYAVFMVGWLVIALPLLAGAVVVLNASGNAAFLIAWAAISATWLALLFVVGPVNN